MEEPDPSAVKEVLAEDKRSIISELRRAKKLNFGDDSATINEIESRCEANKVRRRGGEKNTKRNSVGKRAEA